MSSVLSFIGWAVLPNYVTSLLQNLYYGLTIRAGDPRPQPGTPRFDKHRRRIFIFVVTLYLFYTIYESFYEVRAAGDFYSVLGVSPSADERTIKSRFRRLAAQHHPDKLNHQQQTLSDSSFVYLKLAQDTLLDPAVRFGYDRFGPQVNEWRNSSTVRDFLYAGLKQSLTQYIGGLGTILVLNWVYWSAWGRYWRFYTFAALVVLELVLVTQPFSLVISSTYIPTFLRSYIGLSKNQTAQVLYLLPFQMISLARRVSITVHIFISQIAPLYVSRQTSSASGGGLKPETLQRLGHVAQLSRMTDTEASRLLELSLSPFRGDRESVSVLRRGMKEGLVLGSVRSASEVQEAVAQVQRRRGGSVV
ncbi:membrane associated DnaJ chaperone, putative [Talaromyces stipitatus ATCC 10500]|uniref:Membrane associated DnaJ chaperone, putative n=1 Tax=Talaromyces stipitatus (strain ATCC 10500 / CBS 375.48 / QM 6759 / NRRL 1006) TaxID=441959 RepID=B8MU08_TALSN|nr:membrane associated DnaJ chaperone, putative [Talaromyces stipitatus ATCC 10500]EED12641.1 membrane associated DnaJ chaperone, putative [Talaromyces stipitatus ATCC 10500]